MNCRVADKIAACLAATWEHSMLWFILTRCCSLLLELVLLRHQSDQAKDLLYDSFSTALKNIVDIVTG
jgi:hypothetical protein